MDFGTLLIIFLVVDVLILFFVYYLRKKRGLSAADRKFFQEKWQKISLQTDLRHALLEADKLLDLALKKRNYRGSLGEKLKSSAALFSQINDVWFAHKLRNRVAHELDMNLKPKEGERALRCFERALKDLKVLK